jgi:hypothetical protein
MRISAGARRKLAARFRAYRRRHLVSQRELGILLGLSRAVRLSTSRQSNMVTPPSCRGRPAYTKRTLLVSPGQLKNWVLHKNLMRPAIFAPFAFFVIRTAAAAVAGGMWEPAFCAGFQDPRALRDRWRLSSSVPPSERHFHSGSSIFSLFGANLSVGHQVRQK